MDSLKFGILASGELGYHCLQHINTFNIVNCVFTNSKSEKIIDFCTQHQIPIFIGNPRDEKSKKFIHGFEIDVLLSINYLYLVNDYIYEYPKKYAINFHGSLLPKYRGRTPHVWAIINNEKETGITAHLITKNCDEGDIVFQEKVTIDENSTGADLLEEYGKRFPLIIDTIISKITNGSLEVFPQNHDLATYYGKRVPEDGVINWDWQKERIRNWVRAQAKPYPGAFSFVNGKKIIIHQIKLSNHGYLDTDVNGSILKVKDTIIVKVQNGAIELTDYQIENNTPLNVGDLLYA